MVVTEYAFNLPSDSFRERTFQLLSRAYTEVPLNLVETYLGLPAEQIVPGMVMLYHQCARLMTGLPAAQARGWAYDEASKVFKPVKPKAVTSTTAKTGTHLEISLTNQMLRLPITEISSLNTFHFVAHSVGKLET